MPTSQPTVGLLAGPGDALTKEICQALASTGVSAIVRRVDAARTHPIPTDRSRAEARAEQHLRQLANGPASAGEQDLFFNGWTLLF